MDAKGKIMTVTGAIDPDDLGVTLAHEHLHIDSRPFYVPPAPKDEKLIEAPFELKNMGWINYNFLSHKPNLTLSGDDEAIREELLMFKNNGGHSMVENSSYGLLGNGNHKVLKELSEVTGVNIVAGTGFYRESYQKDPVKYYSEEKITEIVRSDLAGEEGVTCGLIGEVGSSWPITDFEKRSIRSAANVQLESGRPVSFHPGQNQQAPPEIMRIFLEAGGKVDYAVMAHLDRTIFDTADLLDFSELGSYLEYDLFGLESSHYPSNEKIDTMSDAHRIQCIKTLLDNGYEDRVVISHDIFTKHRLVKYGGHGYSHILVNIVPKMTKRGISQEQVDKMLIHNPRNWLTIQ